MIETQCKSGEMLLNWNPLSHPLKFFLSIPPYLPLIFTTFLHFISLRSQYISNFNKVPLFILKTFYQTINLCKRIITTLNFANNNFNVKSFFHVNYNIFINCSSQAWHRYQLTLFCFIFFLWRDMCWEGKTCMRVVLF